MDKKPENKTNDSGEVFDFEDNEKKWDDSKDRNDDTDLNGSCSDSFSVGLSENINDVGARENSGVRDETTLKLDENSLNMNDDDSKGIRIDNNVDTGVNDNGYVSHSSLGGKKSPREEYSFKSTVKSINKMRSELNNINNLIITSEKMYKSSLLSNKFIGNLFSSFKPFISGINRFTVRDKPTNPLEVTNNGIYKDINIGTYGSKYLKYSTQWYILAKRRNAELLTVSGCHIGNNLNQTTLNREINRIEQTVKFRLGLQSEKSLFLYKKSSSTED
ncbi:hypothetical protein FG379_000521 [Cryptosporidium bovis]|uniref:uncharacterized protein n=1 Tax=Cryptosporidium bovis TaxID=310047 RepID=UPI003519F382|nr:hypothetical protein FG379_000521 [Cryptosporidium bovis]